MRFAPLTILSRFLQSNVASTASHRLYNTSHTSTTTAAPATLSPPRAFSTAHHKRADRTESTALRLCEDMQSELSRRMNMANDTARAIRVARETIDAETMLAQAKSQADAWHDVTAPSALHYSHRNDSVLRNATLGGGGASVGPAAAASVRAITAERDELRFLLRKAAAELNKVEAASGGGAFDMASLCLADLERLASIKSQVALEHVSFGSSKITWLFFARIDSGRLPFSG